jgi:hypothetical protein
MLHPRIIAEHTAGEQFLVHEISYEAGGGDSIPKDYKHNQTQSSDSPHQRQTAKSRTVDE